MKICWSPSVNDAPLQSLLSNSVLVQLAKGQLPDGCTRINSSKNAVAILFTPTQGAPLFVKLFLPRSRWESLKAMFRGGRSQRAASHAEALIAHGFATPKVIGWGTVMQREFLVTEMVQGKGLRDHLVLSLQPPLTRDQIREKRMLLRDAGSLVGRLHRAGFVHGDLRPNNVLLQGNRSGWKLLLIDNERNRQWIRIPLSRIRKNLIQINVLPNHILSRTDRMRLYLAYAREYPRFEGHRRKEFLRDLYRRIQERIRYCARDRESQSVL